MEGVVAKPIKTLKTENNHKEEVRAMVKLKNAGFTEVAKPIPKGTMTPYIKFKCFLHILKYQSAVYEK